MGYSFNIGQVIKVHFKGRFAYLSPTPISLLNTNLPTSVKQFDQVAHWVCRILRFDYKVQKLYLEVQNYHLGSSQLTQDQESMYALLKKVKSLHFRSVDTGKLLMTMRSTLAVKRVAAMPLPSEPTQPELVEYNVDIPFSECTIEFGGLYFSHAFKGYLNEAEVFVENSNLRPEFDAIKSYFQKVLGKDSLSVSITVEHGDGHLDVVKATSKDLELINDDLIDQVRFEFVRSTKSKGTLSGIDKSIFTMDEYFEHIHDASLIPNTFHRSGLDLFADLLQVSDSKHYKQLQYLAARHCSTVLKLRFVLDPMSFLFLLEGRRDYHVIWETLDTKEATYVWHARKNKGELKSLLRRVETILAAIRSQGKMAYLSSYQERFHRITHDYSQVVDGFIKWRGQLETVLT